LIIEKIYKMFKITILCKKEGILVVNWVEIKMDLCKSYWLISRIIICNKIIAEILVDVDREKKD